LVTDVRDVDAIGSALVIAESMELITAVTSVVVWSALTGTTNTYTNVIPNDPKTYTPQTPDPGYTWNNLGN